MNPTEDKQVNPIEGKIDIDIEEEAFDEKVKSTKALIQTFLQTLKAFRLYEASHPILTKFLDKVRKAFDEYFNEFESFSLQIGEYRLFYRGKVVYENQEIKESLAFVFYKDGIRELQFVKGLEFAEVVEFLNIVRKGDFLNRMEDDLVTLFWEKDFSHISFTTVDEFLEGSGIFVPATEEELLKGLEFKPSMEDGAQAGENEAENAEDSGPGGLEQVINPAPGLSLVQACSLTPDEREKITWEVQREQQPEYIYVLITNLVEILLHLGEDVDAYENMISYFDRVIEFVLEQREVRKAVRLLLSLNDAVESIALKDKQIFAIRRILDNASSPHNLELLGTAMKGNGEVDSEAIVQYLHFLTPQAVNPLCILLNELESGKWRKVICEQLVELSREDIQPLTKFLSDTNPLMICQILYILGKIEHPSTPKYLAGLVTHHDLKVKEETLLILNKFGEKGKELIQKFLKDPVPGIRSRAAIALARSAKRGAVKPLTDIILSEEFYKRSYEEKASFFKALGETGATEIVPILEKIAKKRTWFQKEKWREMKQCAAHTLMMLREKESPAFPVQTEAKVKAGKDGSSGLKTEASKTSGMGEGKPKSEKKETPELKPQSPKTAGPAEVKPSPPRDIPQAKPVPPVKSEDLELNMEKQPPKTQTVKPATPSRSMPSDHEMNKAKIGQVSKAESPKPDDDDLDLTIELPDL